VVSFTADPTPALASGSEPMIDSVAGALVRATPQDRSTRRQASTEYVESAVRNDSRIRPMVDRLMPAATTYFVPNRWTNRGESGATIIIGMATAKSRRPVW